MVFSPTYVIKPKAITDVEEAYIIIHDAIIKANPLMIARFGSTELNILTNYIGLKNDRYKYIQYIKGKSNPWWWEKNRMKDMEMASGFFPSTPQYLTQFAELMITDIPQIDILGSWRSDELIFEKDLSNAHKITLELLNPYFSNTPWTGALENKKVLVVHPFTKTIERQYKKREFLFEKNVLPYFELKTIKAVQSIVGSSTLYKSWFEALDYMKAEIDKVDYDICLIGAGAYGLPLAAHVKRQGKIGIHLGGSLQLLFGIKGKRWENENYNPIYNYAKLMNEHWVKPDESEKPQNAEIVEGACYW